MADILLDRCTTVVGNRTCEPCCICLTDMELDEQLRMLACGHRMHGACLRGWLRGKAAATCPLCKAVTGRACSILTHTAHSTARPQPL